MEGIKDILQEMLLEIIQKNPNEYKTAFEILTKLFSNIIEHPEEKKFRIFKRSNATIIIKISKKNVKMKNIILWK